MARKTLSYPNTIIGPSFSAANGKTILSFFLALTPSWSDPQAKIISCFIPFCTIKGILEPVLYKEKVLVL